MEVQGAMIEVQGAMVECINEFSCSLIDFSDEAKPPSIKIAAAATRLSLTNSSQDLLKFKDVWNILHQVTMEAQTSVIVIYK